MPPSRARRYMGQSVTFDAVELDLAGVGNDHAAGHAEAGGLAGAVRPQQADDLAALDAKVDSVDHAPRPVDFHQSFGFKHGEGLGLGLGLGKAACGFAYDLTS